METPKQLLAAFSNHGPPRRPAEAEELSAEEREPIPRDRLAEAYIAETKKIDLWTYLFRQLTNIADQLHSMCEIERKPEFCKGVLEALRGIQEEFQQLEKRLMIELERPSAYRPFAWNLKRSEPSVLALDNSREMPPDPPRQKDAKPAPKIRLSPNLEQVKGGRAVPPDPRKPEAGSERKEEPGDERFDDLFDENAQVEFRLLAELVNEGRLSFYDAIVLIIRERAAYIADVESRRSLGARKYSLEESEERPGSTPLDMHRLVKRVQTKLRLGENELEKDRPREVLEQRMNEKLLSADSRRSLLQSQRVEASSRALLSRTEQVRNRQELEVQQRQENLERKDQEYYKRKLLKLDLIRQKAKENRLKASEISFLLLLEKNAKKNSLDLKLEETRKRRLKIVARIAERQRAAEAMITTVKSRKETLLSERASLVSRRLQRVEEAHRRRKQLLEEKAKRGHRALDESFNSKTSDPHPLPAQGQRFLLLYLLDEKEKLDQVFKTLGKQEQGFEAGRGLCKGRALSAGILQTSRPKVSAMTPEQSFELAKSKRKGRNKKKRKDKKKRKLEGLIDSPDPGQASVLSDSERTEWGDDPKHPAPKPEPKAGLSKDKKMLLSYYKFLTMDAELNDKVKKLRARNPFPSQRGLSFSGISSAIFADQISELPEFFCRELAGKDDAPPSANPGALLPTQRLLCALCDQPLRADEPVDTHLASKAHKRAKLHYGVTLSEETGCVVAVSERELAAERLAQLRRKCKKIKQQLGLRALKNEGSFGAKESFASANKPRLQKLALEFERVLQGPKKDYDSLRLILTEVGKLLEKNVENDLHLLRQARFINAFVEFFKGVNVSLKFEMPGLIEIFNDHFKVFARLMILRENRNYLLLTNRALPLCDLLFWSWAQSPRHLQCLDYIPQIMHIITLLLKSKLPEDKAVYKAFLIEYICFSGFLGKIRGKFMVFGESAEPADAAPRSGQVLAKTLGFLETLTACLENQRGGLLAENPAVSPSVFFVLREVEVCGCLQLLASLLLAKGQYRKSTQLLPQALLVQAFLILKVFNNFARASLPDCQHVLGGQEFNSEQFYHILVFLFDYCTLNFSTNGEIFDLLQQLILLTGYFALNNPRNQNLLSRGTETHTIVYKLANLPFQFYFGDFVFKDLLFPTLLSLVHRNRRNLQILLSEVNKNILLDYIRESREFYKNYDASQSAELIIKYKAKMEKEQCSLSSNSNAVTSIQNCYHILPFRFPVEYLDSALEFIEGFSDDAEPVSEAQ